MRCRIKRLRVVVETPRAEPELISTSANVNESRSARNVSGTGAVSATVVCADSHHAHGLSACGGGENAVQRDGPPSGGGLPRVTARLEHADERQRRLGPRRARGVRGPRNSFSAVRNPFVWGEKWRPASSAPPSQFSRCRSPAPRNGADCRIPSWSGSRGGSSLMVRAHRKLVFTPGVFNSFQGIV